MKERVLDLSHVNDHEREDALEARIAELEAALRTVLDYAESAIGAAASEFNCTDADWAQTKIEQDACRAARALLQKPTTKALTWQPAATAPVDEWVLIWAPGWDKVAIGRLSEKGGKSGLAWYGFDFDPFADAYEDPPTLWLRVPDPREVVS